MNRRTFTASLAGLLGVVGLAGKAKAAPKSKGRTLNVRGPVTLAADANGFDIVNVYPGGSVTFAGCGTLENNGSCGCVTMFKPEFPVTK